MATCLQQGTDLILTYRNVHLLLNCEENKFEDDVKL